MNSKIYNGNVQPNPKEFKIWVDDEGTIRTWNGTEWIEATAGEGGSGGDVLENYVNVEYFEVDWGRAENLGETEQLKQMIDMLPFAYWVCDGYLQFVGITPSYSVDKVGDVLKVMFITTYYAGYPGSGDVVQGLYTNLYEAMHTCVSAEFVDHVYQYFKPISAKDFWVDINKYKDK